MSTTLGNIREKTRGEARKELLERHPSLDFLFDQMDNYMGNLIKRMTDIKTTNDKDLHFYPLIVTFVRLHYSIVDFLLSCDVIEASVLLRKQIEILARFLEVEKDMKQDRVPNVRAFGESHIRRLYGELSEIVHYAKEENYHLLGYENETNPVEPTAIQVMSKYDGRVLDTISNHCEVFDHFFKLMLNYQSRLIAGYITEEEDHWYNMQFVPTGKRIGLKYFC